MSSNLYDILGVSKSASAEEIKKAYRKKAMEYHPDRNKGDKNAEKKFKEINEAYSVLSDLNKKKQYDMFGATGGNPFGGGGTGGASGFGGFEDIFGGFGGGGTSSGNTGGFEFNIEDLFGGMGGARSSGRKTYNKREEPKKEETLDFEKIYEVPIFDLILGCKIEVSGVYGTKVKLKIPAGTKPGAKFRVKGLGKKENGKEGNLIVKIEGLMPKNISDVDKSLLERIRENVGY